MRSREIAPLKAPDVEVDAHRFTVTTHHHYEPPINRKLAFFLLSISLNLARPVFVSDLNDCILFYYSFPFLLIRSASVPTDTFQQTNDFVNKTSNTSR